MYDLNVRKIFNDKDLKSLLWEKFKSIEGKNIEITEKGLEKFVMGQQDTPSNLLPTDTEIYSNKLYYINDKGLFYSTAHRNKSENYLVSSRPVKLWDCKLLSIKANKYPQLALSGGNDGLFELDMSTMGYHQSKKLKTVDTSNNIYKISDHHSSFSNYTYLSIYNTSIIKDSFMALFNWEEQKDEEINIFTISRRNSFIREYEKEIPESLIFKQKSENSSYGISWGVDDKIYRATDKGFEIVRFNNRIQEHEEGKNFTKPDFYHIDNFHGNVISGGTTYFGNIVEYENSLFVIQSDGNVFNIPEPITRWRIYPRSMNYENHLHVILDDRIEIYSFNHDYFLNQSDKIIGLEYIPETKFRRMG